MITWLWKLFWLDRKGYQPYASRICYAIMPCLPEWVENHQHDYDNDNSRM